MNQFGMQKNSASSVGFILQLAQHRFDPDCGVLNKYLLNRTEF